jgi:hypothetical protein
MNSSESMRPMKDAAGACALSRFANSCSAVSPASWPSASLISCRESTSNMRTATTSPGTVIYKASWWAASERRRLGSPVSGSW